MALDRRRSAYGRFATIFTVAFVVVIGVLVLLNQFGMPDAVIGTILGAAALVAFTAIGLNAATMQTSAFFLAERALPPQANGAAGAAAAVSGGLYLGLAGAYFADAATAAALVVGWCFGLLILTVTVLPYLRKSSAFGIADFLGIRYDSRLVRLAGVIIVVAALLAALAATLAIAAYLVELLFGLGAGATIAIVVVAVAAPVVVGGMSALTVAGVAQYVVLLVAILLPATIIAGGEYDLPVPPLAFGFAARDAGLLAIAAGRDVAAPLAGQFLAVLPHGALAALATAIAVAGGVAVLPHLAMRGATVRGANRARLSAAWMALLVALVVLAAPAYGAFTRLVVLRDVADTFIGDAPGWLFTLGKLGLAKACGVTPVAVDSLAAACRALPGFDGTLHADQIAISTDALTLFGPSILGLPFAFTALIAAGALAAALAAAGAMAFAIASAVGHDFVGGVVGTRVTGGRQLIVTRLALAAVVMVAAWIGSAATRDAFLLAPLAISLSAGALLPAVVVGIWWKRANAGGALAGMLLGGAVTVVIALAAVYPDAALFDVFGLPHLGLGVMTAGLAGMPLGAVAVVLGSLATTEPSDHEDMLVDAIRRPGGPPIVQENESL